MTAATSTESTDVREAARRQAEREGVSLGQWLDAAMLAHASRLGLTVSTLSPDQRVEAIMERLPRPEQDGGAATDQLRTGTAGHGGASGSGPDEPGRETQTTRRAGMPAVAMLRESFEDTMVEDQQPGPLHASLAMSSPARLDVQVGTEALSRADRAATAASRQAAQRMEIETKLNALFKALDRTPRRNDHAPAESDGDETETRKQALLGETAISPSWRLEKAVAEIAERQAFLERQTAAETLAPVARNKGPRFGSPRAAAEDLREQFGPEAKQQTGSLDAGAPAATSTPEGVPSIFTSLQGDIARLAARLDDDARQAARAPRIDPTIDLLGRRVEALSAKLDRVIERRAPDEAIERLSQRIEEVHTELAGRLTAAATPALDMDGIEKLIHDLVERADRPGRSLPDMRGLESAVHDLALKIERAERSGTNAQGPIAELQDQIGQLAQRIDRSDAGLNAIVAMERSLGDIFAQIRDVRGAAIEAAQSVARSAAEDAVQNSLATVSQRGSAVGGTDPAVEQVSQELAELRTNRDEADKRLHAILAALNMSLERVVDRLGALEQDAGTSPAARAAGPDATTSPVQSGNSRVEALPSEERLFGPAFGQPLDLDQPIEPGLAAHQRLAPPEVPAVDGAGVAPSPDPATFIAAARRAAQNAAQEHALRLDDDVAARVRAVPPSVATRGSASRFKTGMLSRRRPLLLTLAGIVLLMGAAQIARMSLVNDEPVGSLTTGDTTATTPAAPASKAETDAPSVGRVESQPAAPAVQSANKDARAALGAAPLATAPQTAPAPDAKSSLASTDPVPARQALPTMAMGPAASVAALKAADGATRAVAAGVIPAGLQAMADGGNAGAQFEVGLRHAEGRGVPRDLAVAATWFEKAAKQGLAPAAYRLGSLYEKGLGVERDAPQSIAWYSKAAEAGNLRAMHNLAVMLAEGAVGKPDYTAAARWFTKAAEGGVRDSQYNLAILSARGMGVEQNLGKAFTWFSLAAAQGDDDAAKKRDEVAGRLDPAALADARKAADTFKPAPANAAANEVAPPAGGWDALPAPSARQQGSGNAHVSKL